MPRAVVSVVLLVAVLATGSSSQTIPQNTGAATAWLAMLKLRTTASVLHITAHPDDEHGGVLAKLSRADGARVALLTLNRGESGDNAIGPQLFDALGLIRTEELLQANRYYGVDEQYFTSVVDYGYSKTLEESLRQWGRDTVLRDVVRVIRMSRPTVILSRFQGNERDGHGNHSTAGVMAVEAFRAAADPKRFPEQIAEGLRPWQAAKAYVGGFRENEDWTLAIDSGVYDPLLGDSYSNVARMGLSLQRSQTSGRFTPVSGPNLNYYRAVIPGLGPREANPFEGLPSSIEAAISVAGEPIDAAVAKALAAFTVTDPSRSAAPLADGLRLTREAITQTKDAEVLFLLRIKERQFQDAINAAVGAELRATTNPPAMAAPVPGQAFDVDVRFDVRGRLSVASATQTLVGDRGWRAEPAGTGFRVTLADDVAMSTKPYFSRKGLHESRYTLSDPALFGKPVSPAPLTAVARYEINGVAVELRETVKRREAKLPYGEVTREVRSVPRLAVAMSPAHAIVPTGGTPQRVSVEVSIVHNADAPTSGSVSLTLPAGWISVPARQPFSFTRVGERGVYRFNVTTKGSGTLEAMAIEAETAPRKGGPYREGYREGYEVIDHRDLEVRYLYRPATTEVRSVDVITVPGLKVGYVMGIGDQVPMALQQLGAQVTLLGERELASADLSGYDAIMTGTRAYAVREDLKTYNNRLLDYVRAGGNMIVLYNTQELVPSTFAPFPGELPRNAEEVSEEDSPVTVLAAAHQSFSWPNKITTEDFDGWVEQRGSKFFTKWDAAYTPMISTFDKGQAPQSGGWLTAKVGKGHWTYFAYALHRQLPYGVAGAFRITANLLALGKQP